MPDSPLKALANLKNHNWFITALENVQASKRAVRTDPGWIHPSSLSHPCDAYIAFQYLGAPSVEEISARLRRIYDLGSGRDTYLKADTRRAGVSLIQTEADRKIEIPELRIRGELDEWVKNPMSGETMVIDFKTMNDAEWQALKEQKPAHTMQIQPYMFAKKSDIGGVLYENKNNQEWKLFTSKFNHKMWNEDIVGRIRRILDQLKNGHSPQRTPIPNENRCPFYAICAVSNLPQMAKESGLPLSI